MKTENKQNEALNKADVIGSAFISMTDFVLEQSEVLKHKDDCEFAYLVRKYATFLKQPLKLEMFMPCDEKGNILQEPERYERRISFDDVDYSYYKKEVAEYINARKKVLFEGEHGVFDDWCMQLQSGFLISDISKLKDYTIEDLQCMLTQQLKLTDSAIERIFGQH